jgi:hypothetical protein
MIKLICYAVLLSLCSLQIYAFDLFDADRGTDKATAAAAAAAALTNATPPPSPPPPPPPPPPAPAKPQQDFTLRATSRIGDSRSVILQGPDGREFVQHFVNNQRTPVRGYPTYALLNVISRQAVIEYPTDSPCRTSNAAKGIQCKENGKIAEIKIIAKGAIAPPPPPPAPPPAPNPVDEKNRADEELKKRQELYKNFQKQVIRDEDVPPGMRVVRTPFGDRLIPAK